VERGYKAKLGKGLLSFQERVILLLKLHAHREEYKALGICRDYLPMPKKGCKLWNKRRADPSMQPNAVYKRLFCITNITNARKVWEKLYKQYLHKEMSPAHKFILRFASCQTLGYDIMLFFKYKRFPSIKCKVYRRRMMDGDINSASKKECVEYWKMLLPTIKTRHLPEKRARMPKMKKALYEDMKSYASSGYFISLLNEATREMLGNFKVHNSGMSITKMGNKVFLGAEKEIPGEIWTEIVRFMDRGTTVAFMNACRSFYGIAQSFFNHEVVITGESAWRIPPMLLSKTKKIKIKGLVTYAALDFVFGQINKNGLRVLQIHPHLEKHLERYQVYLQKRDYVFPRMKEVTWRRF